MNDTSVSGSLSRRSLLSGAGTTAIGAIGLLSANKAFPIDDQDGEDGKQRPDRSGQRCRPAAPRPIPGFDPDLASLGIFEHLFLPVPGREPSTIFDFAGHVAIMDLVGDGIRTVDGVEEPAAFRADLRFMAGTYVGLDGSVHRNTFGFI